MKEVKQNRVEEDTARGSHKEKKNEEKQKLYTIIIVSYRELTGRKSGKQVTLCLNHSQSHKTYWYIWLEQSNSHECFNELVSLAAIGMTAICDTSRWSKILQAYKSFDLSKTCVQQV